MSEQEVETLAAEMHDAYERAAVGAGWNTQQQSRKPWAEVPEANKDTMRAMIREVVLPLVAQARRDAAEKALDVFDAIGREWQDSPDRTWVASCGEDLLEVVAELKRASRADAIARAGETP